MEQRTNWLYWGIAAGVVLGILYVGAVYFRPLLTATHVLICIGLILIVLLQSGRAADLAGAFGGAGSQTAFGPRGAASFLSKATEFLAVAFMVTSLVLGAISAQSGAGTGSALPETAPGVEETVPADEAPATDAQTPPGEDASSDDGATTGAGDAEQN